MVEMEEIEEEVMVLKFKEELRKFRDIRKKLKKQQDELFDFLKEKYPEVINHPLRKLMFEICLYTDE